MIQTIYKYPLRIDDKQAVSMPKGAQILSVQMQHGRPCLWALVNPVLAVEERTVLIRGTGHDAPGVGRYISTFQMQGRALVFHAFEQEPKP